MKYSYDLRRKVVEFVENGGSKTEASRRFSVSRRTITYWFARESLRSTPVLSRHRKIDKNKLIQFVNKNPSAKLCDYAEHFGVSINSIWTVFQKLGIRKKNDALSGKGVYKED